MPNRIMTDEERERRSQAAKKRHREHPLPQESCDRMRAKLRGRVSPMKGVIMSESSREKMSTSHTGLKLTDAHRANISKGNKGLKRTPEQCENIARGHIGQPCLTETRKKLSIINSGEKHPRWGKRGADSPTWRGGLTAANDAFRNSFAHREWRNAVFAKNNYTCVSCGQVRGDIEADHIKPLSIYNGTKGYPDIRLDVSNGRTLCRTCHRKTDTYGMRGKGKNQLARANKGVL